MSGDEARGVVSRIDSQALASLIEMSVDRMFGDAEPPADLFGAEMLIDQPETFPLARGQCIEQ